MISNKNYSGKNEILHVFWKSLILPIHLAPTDTAIIKLWNFIEFLIKMERLFEGKIIPIYYILFIYLISSILFRELK